ncbi:kinase-like protein [Gigaspora margarita]|uniref:Kinase-like protein n=1 Tax=Gigaspora margarita TaxID=4874 RepID=A0A8H3WYP8_GIGMA|nr:kinase-like protein [Gigaspora margarita]
MVEQLDYLEQLEELLVNYKIKEFDFTKHKNRKKIAHGGFSDVYSIVFEGTPYALKCLKNNLGYYEFKLLKREIKLLHKVDHRNIIKLYGISRAPAQTEDTTNIMLVLKLANGGNLRDHLAKKQQMGLYKILWIDLIQIGMDITNGLKYLHDNGIIHRDLHSKNILINDGNALISDFGYSQKLNDSITFDGSDMIGVIPYIEPQCFVQTKIKRDQASDIYSLGVLFWELTSGTPPFSNFSNQLILITKIPKGLREKPISNTPLNYVNLYNQCWSSEPNKRPTLEFVLDELKKLQTTDIVSITHVINEQWIKCFSLNKGRNLNRNKFVIGRGIILGDDGELKIEKIRQSIPIIYFPKGKNGLQTENNNAYIHIPVLTLHYECNTTSEFIQNIREVINISDTAEKFKKLGENFNYYGEYVVTSVIVGGILTIKNWSEINNKNKSRLKAYLQLGIDYAKGIRLKNFENTPIDDLHIFVNSKNLQNAGNLYKWIKDLHNSKDLLEIISYETFKPSFQLLPEDLIQKIHEFYNVQYIDEAELISGIQTQYDKKIFPEWITSSELPLYICDWIQDNLLQHGIVLHRSKPGRAKKAALKFLKEPEIIQIDKITIILTQPKTRQEVYLFENGLILKNEDELELNNIPFIEHRSTNNIPLEDFENTKEQFSNAIYCQIIFNTIKISFDTSDVEYLREFLSSITSAHQDSESSRNLCKLFGNDYGYLLPRTFTLGGILSKKYISNNHPKDFPTQRLDLKYDDPNASQKIEQLLETWNKEFKDVNTFYFINNEGDVIYRNKIGDWLNTLANNPKNWSIISSEDWMKMYNVSNPNT